MKKLAFLFSGESRCNPLSHNSHKRNEILESCNNFLFTKELKENYKYDIFISTDDIHLENTYNYFGIENIKNVHLLNTNFYFETINKNIPNVDHYINRYRNQPKKKGCTRYEGSIYQHYKILDCFNLLENYTSYTDYDYIIRLRLDTVFDCNLLECIQFLDLNSNVQLLTRWDFFGIGKPDIMKCFCSSLNNKYGTYTFNSKTDNLETVNICLDYNNLKHNEFQRWTYAPEIQLFETLFEFCEKNQLDINETIKDVLNKDGTNLLENKTFCYIVR